MSATTTAHADTFGMHLRRWRKARGKSQLDLSLLAGYSQRHLSFVESGRARPSRATVVVLCEALGVPLAARNELLLAAGFAPIYREHKMDSPELAPFRELLQTLLERQDPFPALVVDDGWTLVFANAAAVGFLGWLRGGVPLPGTNVVRWCFDDDALKPHIVEWPIAARHLYWRLQRDALGDPDNPRLAALLAELQPRLPAESLHDLLDGLRPAPPIMMTTYKRLLPDAAPDAAPAHARIFSLLATVGTAQDVTLSGLHLETFLPADEATRALFEELSARRRSSGG